MLHFVVVTSIFVKKINFLNYSVDFNKTWNGKRILGDHKTYRGFFFGTLGAFLFFCPNFLLLLGVLLILFSFTIFLDADVKLITESGVSACGVKYRVIFYFFVIILH